MQLEIGSSPIGTPALPIWQMADGCRSEYEVLDDEAEANSGDGCETTAECKYT